MESSLPFSTPPNSQLPGSTSIPTQIRAGILRKRTIDNLPSASGIECVGNELFIIGDDAPWLYVLDHHWHISSTISLLPPNLVDASTGRIPKPLKPDFESMTTLVYRGERMLLLVGSGSLSPQRDIGYILSLDTPSQPRPVSFTEIFAQLRTLPTVVGTGKLNIEGTAATAERIYLLQRGNVTGNNVLVEYPLLLLLDYLLGLDPAPPTPVIHFCQLPAEGDVQSGFSGATFIPNSSTMLFTASLENTTNEIDDGEVLGSFVGLVDVQAPVVHPICVLLTLNGQLYSGKVESISVKEVHSDGSLTALAVTDNDLGGSELLEIRITF